MMDSYFPVLKACGEIFDNSYVVVDYTKEDRPLVYINDAFARLSQYSREEIIGRNCRFLQGKETSLETVEKIRSCLNAGESGWFDILNYRQSGEPFWNRLTLIPIGGEIDPVKYYLGIQQDISDLKRQGILKREYGPLRDSHKNFVAPLMKVLNAHRSMKYIDLSDKQEFKEIERLAALAKDEVLKISQYVRGLH